MPFRQDFREMPGAPATDIAVLNSWFTARRYSFVLIALLLLAFPDVLLLGKSFYFRDYAFFTYPLSFYQRECFWNGELPFWNGYHNLGQPFLAQWNTMVLYPGSLIYLLLPLPWSLNFFCITHLFLGGLGMFLLARHLLNQPFAAAFAGLAYTFNGFTLNCLMFPHNVAAWGWLPWVLLSTMLACRNGGRMLPLAALAGAMQFLTGGAEIILQTWFVAGCFMLLDVWQNGWHWKAPARLALIVLLVTALSSIQLLPFLDLLKHSQRDASWSSSDWSMPAWGWLNLLVPKFGSAPAPQGMFNQIGQAWVNSYYPGCIVVLMATLALWCNRSKLLLAGWMLVLLSVGIAQGGEGFLYDKIKELLPQLGYIRYPIKFVFIALVLLPILAATGLCEILSSKNKPAIKRFIWMGSLLAFIAFFAAWLDLYLLTPDVNWETTLKSGLVRVPVFALFAFLTARLSVAPPVQASLRLALALLFVLWADHVMFNSRQSPSVKPWVYRPNIMHEQLNLKEQTGPGSPRFLPNAQIQNELGRTALIVPEEQVAYYRLALFDNLNLLDHLPKLHGFYPMDLKHFRETLDWFHVQPDETVRPLLEFAGFAYTQMPGKAVEWHQKWDPQPLVTAGQRPVKTEADGVLTLLEEGRFNPMQEVYFYPQDAGDLQDVIPGQAKIESIEWREQSIRFKVNAAKPSMVVLAQTYYHPWVAEISGTPTLLRRANHSFTALKVPAGNHEVKLTYVDRNFRLGLLISGSALIAVLVMLALSFKKAGPVTAG